ncbi:MAG: hypothetical protein ACYS9V_13000 [Planctomycetota bacterium]|jgi:hypothetical protein
MKKELINAIDKAVKEYQDYEGDNFIGNIGAFILRQHTGQYTSDEFSELRPVVRRFYDLLDGNIADEDGEVMDFDMVLAQFAEIVVDSKVKHFKRNVLDIALSRALKHKSPRPEFAEYNKDCQLIGSVCYELQQIQGKDPFWIRGEDAGRIIGKTQPIGHKYLKLFVADKKLKLIKKGHTGFASEYRLNGKPTKGKLTDEEFEQSKKKNLILVEQMKDE